MQINRIKLHYKSIQSYLYFLWLIVDNLVFSLLFYNTIAIIRRFWNYNMPKIVQILHVSFKKEEKISINK